MSRQTLQARQTEKGFAVESVAEDSMQECLEEEIQETVKYDISHSLNLLTMYIYNQYME